MTDQDAIKAACDLAECPVPRLRCGFASNDLPCRHPSWRDAWERGSQHLQEVEEQLEEVREHVKVQRWQEADYDAHHPVL